MNPKVITTFVILVAAVLVGFFLVFPQVRKAQSARDEFAKKKLTTEKILESLATTKLAISKFKNIDSAQKERVGDALPKDTDLPNLLFLMNSIISSSGLIAENIMVDVAEPGTGQYLAEQATINLTIRGSYESFKAFLGTIEKNLRIFDVETISFSSPERTKEGFGSTRFSVTLKTYFSE